MFVQVVAKAKSLAETCFDNSNPHSYPAPELELVQFSKTDVEMGSAEPAQFPETEVKWTMDSEPTSSTLLKVNALDMPGKEENGADENRHEEGTIHEIILNAKAKKVIGDARLVWKMAAKKHCTHRKLILHDS